MAAQSERWVATGVLEVSDSGSRRRLPPTRRPSAFRTTCVDGDTAEGVQLDDNFPPTHFGASPASGVDRAAAPGSGRRKSLSHVLGGDSHVLPVGARSVRLRVGLVATGNDVTGPPPHTRSSAPGAGRAVIGYAVRSNARRVGSVRDGGWRRAGRRTRGSDCTARAKFHRATATGHRETGYARRTTRCLVVAVRRASSPRRRGRRGRWSKPCLATASK